MTMQYTEIMVRYGELSTKGKNRRNFIDRLATNVRQSFHDFPNLVIKAHRDRMHMHLNGEDADRVMARLRQVFGIQNFSPSIKVDRDMEEVKKSTSTQPAKRQSSQNIRTDVPYGKRTKHFTGKPFKNKLPGTGDSGRPGCNKA